MPRRLDYHRISPDLFKAYRNVEATVRASGLEHSLLHLVKLRASYLNHCAYCVDMHTKDARAAGESEQRLYGVAVWRETPYFTPRERAALAWTDSVTRLGEHGVSDQEFRAVREQFSEQELASLTFAIVMINGWNRLAVSLGAEVGSYEARAPA
ncbi:MAG TPA: carboxymuconolactone decarboxylase family protein [Polyangiaceae bacterium]|nr:carboxymuconolactone decarboxylase family protein [Polyangiaceae bacterium]